jgi:thiol:disulfide interchange protein DsbC
MKKVLLSVLIVFLLLSFLYSQAYSEKESLNLSIDEALILLKDLDPNVKVMAVKPGPVEGLWEVDIESGGKKLAVYVDNSKKYLISGSIIDIKARRNLTQERLDEINKIDVSQIPLDDALVMGDKEAKYRVIVFDDPE